MRPDHPQQRPNCDEGIAHDVPAAWAQRLQELTGRFEGCLLIDLPRLEKDRRQALKRLEGGLPIDRVLSRMEAVIDRSASICERRRDRRAPIPFPDHLPVSECREQIAEAISTQQVVVVCGDTGSGKTTQLPKICMSLGRGTRGLIGHTQPRRIAARSVSARIAEELGERLGASVGFKVRFHEEVGPECRVKVMTDGVLLAEAQRDRQFLQYDTIIIDEAHERSLNIDFLLGYLKRLLPGRPDLRVIITSATIDPERFSAFFEDAPIINVEGRSYPVEVRYLDPANEQESQTEPEDLSELILSAMNRAIADGPGDALVFLSGEREIRETAELLEERLGDRCEILPLYARLSPVEQNRVFKTDEKRRIVLATNVAETSLTVPGIRYVIDTGLARISRYSPRAHVQRLPIEPISRASAAQRAGRCGRIAPGICFRLYSKEDHDQREEFTPPEILRTNLASVLLRMKFLRLGELSEFPFIDPPKASMIRNAELTLQELGATDQEGALTPVGTLLARLPVDPRLGRMVLAGHHEHCLSEILVIAAALEVQDPRVRPTEQAEAADQAHARFRDENSDFLSILKLWRAYIEQSRKCSRSALRRWCQEHFLAPSRMREWRDVEQQLLAMVMEEGMKPHDAKSDQDSIHRAILTGLLRHIARRHPRGHYQSPQGGEAYVFPGSVLFGKTPKWIMAAEFVETTRLFARTAAVIDPTWILRIGSHLLTHRYADPRWDDRQQQVIVSESIFIFGLPIVDGRAVPYAPVAPEEARSIFIHHALVEGELRTDAAFMQHNRRLIRDIRRLEDKVRRRDLLAEQDVIHHFYDQRLPAGIASSKQFDSWRRKAEKQDREILYLREIDVLARPEAVPSSEDYPDNVVINQSTARVQYRFDPGDERDGVTLRLPIEGLANLDGTALDWTIGGLVESRVLELIRALPKDYRRLFVPAPDVAKRVAAALRSRPRRAFLDAVAGELGRIAGVVIDPLLWKGFEFSDYLRPTVAVVDDRNQELAASRDLRELRQVMDARLRKTIAVQAPAAMLRSGITDWTFGTLDQSVDLESPQGTTRVFPMLVDHGRSVSMELAATEAEARAKTRLGLIRLLFLRLRRDYSYTARHLPGIDRMTAIAGTFMETSVFQDELMRLIVAQACLEPESAIRSEQAFERAIQAGWDRLARIEEDVCALVSRILEAQQSLQLLHSGKAPEIWRPVIDQQRRHLGRLFSPGFLVETPFAWLSQYPRYIQAMVSRLEKLRRGGQQKDHERALTIERWRQEFDMRVHAHQYGSAPDALQQLRWMIEEYQVQVFAQELGTAVPVSEKRLGQMVRDVDRALHLLHQD